MKPPKASRWTAWPLILLAVAPVASRAAEGPAGGAPDWKVDHRYAPVWWQTSICLPDDWQKTLVGKEGTLLYDFPGKYSGFKTRIGVDYTSGGQAFLPVKPESKWLRQELVSPRVPIVRTNKQLGKVEIVEAAFAVSADIDPGLKAIFEKDEKVAQSDKPVVERIDRGGTNQNWANPKTPCDPAFRNIAVAMGGSVHYRIRAVRREKYTIVLGLCEGWHAKPGQRILDLTIEGKTRKTVDMVAEHGRNVPVLFPFEARDEDGDGWIDVVIKPAAGSPDKNTILNVLWGFQGEAPPVTELLAGKSSRPALAHVRCGTGKQPSGPPRFELIRIQFHNTGDAEVSVNPVVTIDSEFLVSVEAARRRIEIGDATYLTTTEPFEAVSQDNQKTVVRLAPVRLPAGQERAVAIGALRGVSSPKDRQLMPRTAGWADDARKLAEQYWQKLDLPYGGFEIPDPGIQATLDSSIRNIYQAREIKQGLPAFQVGPTCYRGLWVVDGSFLMEAVAMLGRTDEARNGIRYLLSFQRPDGAIMLIDGHLKETGITLWAVTRHARLTNDKKWLAEVWPQVEKGFSYILSLRQKASADPKALVYGLLPEGFSDGGLGGVNPEYTNVYWTLVGMKAAVDGARWLGRQQEAQAWQREYDDFYAAFYGAAQRDMRTDSHGNRYVPINMRKDLTKKISPQKAQWAFLHAVFPGQVFAADDPLVLGNMAMLRAVEAEGLVRDTGWVSNGVWNYFASFYAHGWLWTGHGQKAARTLYDFANHASPLLCWREEQMPRGEGDAVCGDMPHNWASAEFIRLVRDLLVLERGDELHLFEGLPPAWIQPGKAIRVSGVLTEFGPISLELRVAADGSKATLTLDPPSRNPARRIVVHLGGWSGAEGTIELPARERVVREIGIGRGLGIRGEGRGMRGKR